MKLDVFEYVDCSIMNQEDILHCKINQLMNLFT